jgi:hypothetical protein
MRNSNKVLLITVAAVLAFVLAFVLVMGLTARNLFEQHGGRTVRSQSYRIDPFKTGYRLAEASSTIDLSFSSTPLAGSCSRASSSTARASS